MPTIEHVTAAELQAGLEHIRRSPKDHGVLEMIVRRPATDEREVLQTAELDLREGLIGDTWGVRRSWNRTDRAPDPEMQLNLMNSRVIALVAQTLDRWPLAGDQLFVDLDLSAENLPPGTQLTLGSAVIEVTTPPHTGCRKFKARYGTDAHKFVNARATKDLHLRGICAKVVRSGTIRVGDAIRKV